MQQCFIYFVGSYKQLVIGKLCADAPDDAVQ